MKISTKTFLLANLAALAACRCGHAAELDYANGASTSLNAAASYTPATAPVAASVLFFKNAATTATQPVLNATLTVGGFNFSASGYDVTNANSAVLTLSGYGTSSSGATPSAAAAVFSTITSGTNTFELPITFAPANGTASTTIYQTGLGGNLTFNGNLSGSLPVLINLAATSTVTLNGDNSALTGGITLTGTSVASGAATVAIGSNTALGTGAFAFNSSNATLAAAGGARTLANALTLSGPGVIGGTNNFTFTGAVSPSGALTRTLTVNNTGTTTFSGNVATSDAAATTTRLAFAGTGNVTITGTVANGGSTAGSLSYTGSGILTLSAANTYSGGTSVSGGSLVVTATGTLGSGNVTIANGITLTLSTGVTNAIADTATLTLGSVSGTNATLTLNGTAGTPQETVNSLIVNGVGLAAGTYGPIGDNAANFQSANITGTGELKVLTTSAVPEPSTWATAFVSVALLGVSMRRFRRRSA